MIGEGMQIFLTIRLVTPQIHLPYHSQGVFSNEATIRDASNIISGGSMAALSQK